MSLRDSRERTTSDQNHLSEGEPAMSPALSFADERVSPEATGPSRHVQPPPAEQARGESANGGSKLSRSQKWVVIALALSNFSSFLAFATIAPFFPGEATRKGASDTEIGLIFGVFELVVFIMSPIYGSLVPWVGPRFLYLSGLFICSVCIVLFGFLDGSPPGAIYVALCFICRIMDANGTAMLTTASFTIMAHTFPDHLSLVMGILEACVALGAMCGPPLGGALYEVGGFRAPFFVVGGALLVTFICSYIAVPYIVGVPKGKRFHVLLKIPDAVLSFFQMFAANFQVSFTDPTLAKQILSIDSTLGAATIGSIFLAGPGIYALLAPVIGYLCGKMGDRLKFLTIAGWTITIVGLLLLGPSPLLSFLNKSIWLLVVSLALLGVGLLGCWLPSYQLCLEAAIKGGYADNIETYGMVAGLLGSGAALGSFVGPAGGAYLTETLGFAWMTTCCVSVAVIMAIVTVVSVVLQRINKASQGNSSSGATECEERAPLLQNPS